jgi:hypothetical protein
MPRGVLANVSAHAGTLNPPNTAIVIIVDIIDVVVVIVDVIDVVIRGKQI